jgi:hypothetical protein
MTRYVANIGGGILSSLSTVLIVLVAFSSIIQYSYFVGVSGKCGTPQASVVLSLFFYGTILLVSSYGGWRLCEVAGGHKNFARRCFVLTRDVFIVSALFFWILFCDRLVLN